MARLSVPPGMRANPSGPRAALRGDILQRSGDILERRGDAPTALRILERHGTAGDAYGVDPAHDPPAAAPDHKVAELHAAVRAHRHVLEPARSLDSGTPFE